MPRSMSTARIWQIIGAELLERRVLLTASTPYTWQNAAIGGGGFVDGIFYSPTQQNVIYARTDIGGLYKTTNDGTTWQQLLDFVPPSTGQMMGVLSFAIDSENSNDIYADTGQYSGSDGWVLSSTNGGASFSTTNLPFYVGGNSNGRGTGERLAVDPNLGSVLFLGSNNAGLYQSTNSAGSFAPNTAFNSLVGSGSGITFVYFDPRSGSTGTTSKTIYVGVDSTNAGTNLYRTTNGGTSWAELTGGPTALIPMRAALDSDGNLYFTFSNDLPPGGNINTGAVWRFNTTSSVWTNISPVVPGVTNGASDTFGYDGLAIDPEHAGTLVVTSFDRYNDIDTIWRTTNASSGSVKWVSLYDTASAQNHGYGGFDTTRNTSTAPWVGNYGDGIGNWAASVAINPFNSSQLMYGNGQGLWATNSLPAYPGNAELTAANSWYFPDYGIEFTAVTSLAAPPSGVPLYSALGDIGGFAHTTFTSSPAAGDITPGTDDSIDFAQSNPSDAAVIGSFTNGGAYSTNDGATWKAFASAPANASGGTIAVSANGATLVWVPYDNPSGTGVPYYSTNNGATWTASSFLSAAPANSTLHGGTIISDRVNPNYFYYSTENSSDNDFILYVSSNGGQSFTLVSQTGTGNAVLKANPFTAGDLWLATYSPLYESTNFGSSFSYDVNSNPVNSANQVALGKAAPGQSYPAIYISGYVNNVQGFFRSDDQARTWVQINTSAQRFGGTPYVMAADPSTYGRVYLGFNGRAVMIGTPSDSLPVNWSDTDINIPGDAGWATSSSNLSNGTVVNTWTVNGGGAGIGGTVDQLNFAAEPVASNYSVVTKLSSLTNNGTGTSQAGVMFRASSNASDPFAALLETSSSQLVFEYRTATGGSVSSTTLSNISVGSYYLDLVRTGSNFSAYYGTNGTSWTQLGIAAAISAIPTTAQAGLAVSADYNPQLASAGFANVQITAAPGVTTPAYVVSQTHTMANLSASGSSSAGSSTLTYTWATTNSPSGSVAPTFNVNGTNNSASTTVTFHTAGTYTFTVTIADQLEQSVTSSVNVTVSAIGAVSLSPATAVVITGASVTFAASGADQFGNALSGFVYTATGGAINSATGVFVAGTAGGSFTVTASSGSNYGTTQVTVVPTSFADTSGNNTYSIDISATNSNQLQIFLNEPENSTPTYTIPLSQVPSLAFSSGSGNDALTVDFTNGDPVPVGGVSFAGGSASNSLIVVGPAGSNSASINSQQFTFDSSPISYSNVSSIAISTGSGNDTLTQTAPPSASVIFGGGSGSNTLNVNAGIYTFQPASPGGLMVNDNSTVVFAPGSPGSGFTAFFLAQLNLGSNAITKLSASPSAGDRTVVVTSGLMLAASSQLDLGNNDMILRNGNLATTANDLQQGYASGTWQGSGGILSSAAAADSTHLTTVGAIQNVSTDGTTPLYSTFDGVSVGASDVLVKYTYYGDATLDGQVDGSDYSRIDNGYLQGLTGWQNGDFNYDGVINGSDYTLIDNAFNTQGTSLAAQTASPAARNAATKSVFASRKILLQRQPSFSPAAAIPTAQTSIAVAAQSVETLMLKRDLLDDLDG